MVKIKTANKSSKIDFYLFLLFPLFSFYLYRYVGISGGIQKGAYFAIFLVAGLITSRLLFYPFSFYRYGKLVRSLLLVMVASIFLSYLYWGQHVVLGFRVTAFYMAIIYFFILLKYKPTLSEIKTLIYVYTALYTFCWIYGMLKAPQLVFGLEREDGIDESRGIFRLSIPGRGFVILCLFLVINNYVITTKKIWIVISVFLFALIVMHVIRQIIFLSLLISILYLIRSFRYFWVYFGLLIASFLFLVNVEVDQDTVLGSLVSLTERQLDDQKSGEENIRILEYKYFFSEYTDNILTSFFGNGVPHSESDFGKRELKMNSDFEFFASDVGYAEIYIRFGIVGLIIYFMIFLNVITQKPDKKVFFAKLFVIYLAVANVTASWVFHDVIALCVCIYVLERDHLSAAKLSHFKIKQKRLGRKLANSNH